MTFEKETVLKTLFPEDVLSIAKGLTDGEVEFLQQVDSLLESKYRENINQHWIDATVPEDYFKDLGELNYLTIHYYTRIVQTPKCLVNYFSFSCLTYSRDLIFP